MNKFTTIVLMIFVYSLQAQDPSFLNPNRSLIYLNPSFAGNNGGIRSQTAIRNQWPNLSVNFFTLVHSFDAYIPALKGGLAFTYFNDDQIRGTLKASSLSMAYAQYLAFNEGALRVVPSVQIGYGNKSLDRENLHYGDMIDPRRGTVWNSGTAIPTTNKSYADISSGFLISYKNFLNVGAYAFHLNRPDEGLLGTSRMPVRTVLHASYSFSNSWTSYQLFCKYENQQAYSNMTICMNMLVRKHLLFGLGYTGTNTPFVNLGFRTSYFSFQVGYDAILTRYGLGANSWEASVSFNARKKERREAFGGFETL